MTRCPKCHARTVKDAPICAKCGLDLDMVRRERDRLRRPSATWGGAQIIPFVPFRALSRSARQALAKLWWKP